MVTMKEGVFGTGDLGKKAIAAYLERQTCVRVCLCLSLVSKGGHYDLAGAKFTRNDALKSHDAEMTEWLVTFYNEQGRWPKVTEVRDPTKYSLNPPRMGKERRVLILEECKKDLFLNLKLPALMVGTQMSGLRIHPEDRPTEEDMEEADIFKRPATPWRPGTPMGSTSTSTFETPERATSSNDASKVLSSFLSISEYYHHYSFCCFVFCCMSKPCK